MILIARCCIPAFSLPAGCTITYIKTMPIVIKAGEERVWGKKISTFVEFLRSGVESL
jgi:hypothetical protein